MKRTNLNYHFHNPNADGVLEKYILQIVVEQGAKQLLAAWKNDSFEKEKETAGFEVKK